MKVLEENCEKPDLEYLEDVFAKIFSVENIANNIKESDIPLVEDCDISKIREDYFYIFYFDILGYKSKMAKYGEGNFLKIIYASMEAIKESCGKKKRGYWGYYIFSDNIIVYCRKSKDAADNMISLLNLINKAFLMQRNLMGQYGILIRGSITEGKLFCGGEFVFGSGLIDAYNMENYKAINPRIIIDRKVMRYINEINSVYDGLKTNICKYINEDDDGEYFIGYINNCSQSQTMFLGYVYMHKNLITTQLEQSTLEENVYAKMLWCKKYHNYICDLYGFEELKIK